MPHSNNDGQRGAAPDRLPLAPPHPTPAALAHERAQPHAPPTQMLSVDVGSEPDARKDDEIDLLEYWRILVRRRWTVLGIVGAVLFAVLVGTLLVTPIYRASTSLQIERDNIKVVDYAGLQPVESSGDRDFYQTQYELLKSRSLAERVASQLSFATQPTVLAMTAPSPWRALLNSVLGRNNDEAPPPEDRAYAGFLLRHLSVEPVRNSRLVQLHFDSTNPEFSARVVDAMGAAFIATNLERRFDASSYAKTFLEERLVQLKQRLEDSDRELVAYAQQEQIVAPGGANTLNQQNLTEMSTALSTARNSRIGAEARWQQATNSTGRALPADILGRSIIRTLQERHASLQATYQERSRLYKPDFPQQVQLQAQIDQLNEQIDDELANIRASLKADFDGALSQERMLEAQMASLKTDALDLQQRSIRYNILQREVETNRQLYEGLLQRYKEIGIAGGVSTNNVSVVDRAMVPSGAHSPRLSLNLAVGLMLGLMLGVLLAIALEYIDDTIKLPEDVERKLQLANLGLIPRLHKNQTPLTALGDQRSAFSEAYRSVRTALQFSTETGVPRVLVVTSTVPGEGKTTTATTLAMAFAQLGKRVLLIDADLRNPSLHRLLKIDNSVGLSNYLSGAAAPQACMRSNKTPLFSIIASGPLPPNPAELLAGPRMLTLLSQASERFDQIIIDAPPVLGLADAPILANLSHGTLLVVEAGGTRVGAAQAALKRLRAARARVLGVVLTKFDSRSVGYGATSGYGHLGYDYHSYGGGLSVEPAKALARR